MAWKAQLQFRDNNGAESRVTLRLPFSLGYDAAVSRAIAIANAMQACSSAWLYRVKMVKEVPTGLANPGDPASSSERVAILFYRNGDDTSSFYLPAPPSLWVDADGAYSGSRVSRGTLSVLGVLASVDALLSGTLDPAGRAYGSYFSVGVITGSASL